MVKSVIESVRAALKYRGGWRGLFNHMYTNGDYPFKFGTYMGCDIAGNRYYENRIDYPFGQHRWVEPADRHNFDATMVPPDWHGWMTSMNDASPSQEEEYINNTKKHTIQMEKSDAPVDHAFGHTSERYNFHYMHNQSQIRSRGYGIGNPVVGLPPGAKDAYYTQPGSPYNEASIRKLVMIGDLDETKGGGRPYKSDKWADRLRTHEEINELERKVAIEHDRMISSSTSDERKKKRVKLLRSRGSGTILGD